MRPDRRQVEPFPRRAAAALSGAGWPLLAAAAALVPFSGGLSTTHVFFVRDLGLYFWPRHLWLWRSAREGDWPLWDPYAGGGQSAVVDALNHFFLLPVTLVRVFAPPVVGFNVWVAAPLPLLAVGMWLWLRRRFSPPAAGIGASVAVLAGPLTSAGDFPNLAWTTALVPWILWSLDRLCDAPTWGRYTALALCVGVQAIAGEPVTFATTCAVVLGYVAIATPGGWTARGTRLLRTLAALAAGVLVAAVQLVPLAVAASRSIRGVRIDATFWSLHPLALIETVVPHVFGHVYQGGVDTLPWVRALNAGREPLFYSLYVGIGALALALVRASDPALRPWRTFWWIVIGAAIVSGLGEYTAAYPAAQRVIPVLNTFRFPVKYFMFAAFGVAALAAAGADVLLRHTRAAEAMARPSAASVLLGVTAVIALVLGVGSLFGAPAVSQLWDAAARRAGVEDPGKAVAWLKGGDVLWLRLAGLSLVSLFLVLVVWRRHRLGAVAAWTLCGVAVIDPLSINADLHPTIEASRLGPPEWVAATAAHPRDRVYIGGRLSTSSGRQLTTPELIDRPRFFLPPGEMTEQEAITMYSTRFAYVPAAWGVREVISYDLPQLWPREYVALLRRFRGAPPPDRQRFLQRTGHRYCYLPQPPTPGAAALGASEIARPMALYECHQDPRRVFIAPSAAIEPDVERQLALLFDERHDPFSTVLLQREAPPPEGRAGTSSEAMAEIVRERNNELVVRAQVPSGGGYLTVMDSYDPYWVVRVDGEPGTLLRANGVFRAVHLAPGPHEVRFVYRPLPFYAGALITGCVVSMLLVGAIAKRPSPRRMSR